MTTASAPSGQKASLKASCFFRWRAIPRVTGTISLAMGAAILAFTACDAPRPQALPLATDALPAVAVEGAPSGVTLSAEDRLDAEILVFEKAQQTDPFSAYFGTQLAARFLQRGRKSGSYADFQRAETAARGALAKRTQNNGAAFSLLVSALLAQHRFEEAAEVARQLVAGNPDIPVYRAALGEVELELGNYDLAKLAFDSVALERRSLSIAPRLARWAELRGDTSAARVSLHRAAELAHDEGGLNDADLAWFDLRVGDFELRNGDLAAAESALLRGYSVAPKDYRVLAALARLHAVNHDWPNAIRYGESSIAMSLDPATLGLLSDSYTTLGDTAKAADYLHTMEIAVGLQPGAFHRAWSIFLLDHGRRINEVYANVRTEARTRHDLYGHDLLGWALYKLGRNNEARAELAMAMKIGTQDALIFYHAGMIERAAGDNVRAAELLQRALKVNPYFDIIHPASARATLDSIGGEGERGG